MFFNDEPQKMTSIIQYAYDINYKCCFPWVSPPCTWRTTARYNGKNAAKENRSIISGRPSGPDIQHFWILQ